MPTRGTNGGVGSAAKQVAEHASTLARLEMELAQLEIKQKVAKVGLGAGLLIGAAVFGLFALGFGLAAAAAALALVLPMWASLLIVCGALVLLAVILLFAGMGAIKKGSPPVPEQAIREAKLTTEAIRNGRS